MSNDHIYTEDDIDLYSQYESIFADYYDSVDDGCRTYDSYFNMMSSSNRILDYDIDLEHFDGNIDADMLKEILRKLISDPRFSHLSVQTMKGMVCRYANNL